MGSSSWSVRRPRPLLVIAALGSAFLVAGIAAWLASPAPTALDARVAARLRSVDGRQVPLSAMAPILRDAVIATEDERFYRHQGIDLIGVLRALPYDLVHLSFGQGASTVTEQVAKLLYLGGNDHDPWRKLEDAALALKLERRYSKEQILAAYLNSTYFGSGAYGVWAASEHFFGVPPRALDTAQATLLAGLIQAPSTYDPLVHPGLARARQTDVLRSLVRSGFLTSKKAVSALDRPLPLRIGPPLPAVQGIQFSLGPAFVWWELAAGATLALIGAAVLVASRRSRGVYLTAAVRILSIGLALLGAAAVVRSFRTV
jgi:membrane peptidoglycan carboxypeptidase